MPDSPEDLSSDRSHPATWRLQLWREQTLVYLTVNTAHRSRWLAAEEPQRLLVETWKAACGWLIGGYILMPDHLHCLCVPGEGSHTLESWIADWKDQFGRKHRHQDWDWRPRSRHRRLLCDEGFADKWHYMRNNPVAAGLVARTEDWPWQGTVYNLGPVTLG